MTAIFRLSSFLSLLLVLSVGIPLHLVGQEVTGVVRDSDSGNPLQNAFVSLRSPNGDIVAGGLTDETGRFSFSSRSGSRYALHARMPGYDVAADQVEVQGDLSHDFELKSHIGVLSSLAAEGQCVPGRPDGDALGALWGDVLGTMEEMEWAASLEDLTFESLVYDRLIRSGSEAVEVEGHDWIVATSQVPFFSPADAIEFGFVQEIDDEQGGYAYFGVGPQVLRADAFYDRHCFRIVEHPSRSDLVAVGFAPSNERPDVPDVEGEIWIDRETGELAELAFRYATLPWPNVPTGEFGGTARYRRNAAGRWLVTDWQVRMPWLDGMLVGVEEQGGELRSTMLGEDESTRTGQMWPAAITGTVYDSTSAAPLAGAEVHLRGTSYTAETDEEGRFQLTGLPGGRPYFLDFRHPRLDRLNFIGGGELVELRGGLVEERSLTVPSAHVLYGQACPAMVDGSGTMIAGTVRDGGTEIAIPYALVYATWQAGELIERAEARTDESGTYVICGVPADERVGLVADFLVHESLRSIVNTRSGQVTVWDFETGESQNAEFRGQVKDAFTDEIIRNADIVLLGTTQRVRSDRDGRFVLNDVQPGEHQLEVSHIAYGTQEEDILIEPDARSTAEIKLNATAIELPGIEVLVEAAPLEIGIFGNEFADRRSRFTALGLGAYMEYDEIQRIAATEVTDIILAAAPLATLVGPGLIMLQRYDPRSASSSESGRLSCSETGPTYYIDGSRFPSDQGVNINLLVPAAQVRAVEVYRRASEIPAEFLDASSDCGVVVIYTSRGPGGNAGGGR